MRIGVFDSGIGGLSVLHRAKKMLPNENFVYYADEKHVPYGEKTPEEIRSYVDESFAFLLRKQVDALVIACNTATSAVSMEYRKKFSVPVIGMEPAVKRAVDLYGHEGKRILVAATPITIKGRKLHDLVERVDQEQQVDLVELPQLVRFAENGVFESPEVEQALLQAFCPYDLNGYGTVVLGCTHFNYFKNSFRKLFAHAPHFVDGNEGTVRQLMRLMHLTEETGNGGNSEFYFSGEESRGGQADLVTACMAQLERVYAVE